MTVELKVCSKCHLELPITSFSVTNASKGWRLAACKACAAARVRAYYAANADYRVRAKANSIKQAKANPRSATETRRILLKYKYGLTQQQFDQLFTAQGGKCALCGAVEHGRKVKDIPQDGSHKWLEDSWPVDHCHKDGRVRGLLCHPCNAQLGGYETLVDRVGMDAVLEYLTRPSPVLALPIAAPVELPPDIRATARFVAELPPRYTHGQCTVCGADQHAGGLCFRHYMRQRRNGDPGPAENLPKGVLTADDVRAIRAASTEWGANTKLAAQYGVTVSMISKIRKGTARTDVTEVSA